MASAVLDALEAPVYIAVVSFVPPEADDPALRSRSSQAIRLTRRYQGEHYAAIGKALAEKT